MIMVTLEERHSEGLFFFSLVVMATSRVGRYDVTSAVRDFVWYWDKVARPLYGRV